MKAVEFDTILDDNTITIPDNLHKELKTFGEKNIRVIVLVGESYSRDDKEYRNMVREEFLTGYEDTDSIYDKP